MGFVFSGNSKNKCADHVDWDNAEDDDDDDVDDDDNVDGDDDVDEWAGLGAVKRASCLFPHCLRFYPQCLSVFAF